MTLPGSVASKTSGLTGDVYAALADQTLAMRVFFGAMPQDVDGLCRLIYVMTENTEAGIPDWLRGCAKTEKLPRYDAACHGTHYKIGNLSVEAFIERLIWIVQHQHGGWRLIGESRGGGFSGLVLVRDEDAVHYRLRWS